MIALDLRAHQTFRALEELDVAVASPSIALITRGVAICVTINESLLRSVQELVHAAGAEGVDGIAESGPLS